LSASGVPLLTVVVSLLQAALLSFTGT